MTIKEIETTLNAFYEGKTSSDQERELYLYFLDTKQLPPHLVAEKDIFMKLYQSGNNQSVEVPVGLESRIDSFIDTLAEQEAQPVVKKVSIGRKRMLWAASVAASVMIIISLSVYWVSQPAIDTPLEAHQTMTDTYENPEEAYQAAEKAIMLASNKANKGFEQLEMMNKILEKNNSKNKEK